MKTLDKIIWIFIIVVIDIVLYIIIGLIIMGYEDMWDISKGPYFSLGSMTWLEKIAFVSYYLLIIANILIIIFGLYKIITKYLINN
ncbi:MULTISPECIES: hypothetical protein [Winogradskyella]|uniref:hypothetical protein n=1 Tax=Winogradskyella TaxID=286104 RepID=UPI001FB42DAE|nr:hypothetical protein [Winogradskyella sp. MH6]